MAASTTASGRIHATLASLCIAGALTATQLAIATAPKKASPQQAAQWRSDIRRALFISTPLPALDPESFGTFSPTPGVIAERVTYGTEYGMRIPAILYHPSSSPALQGTKLPALVVVNGHAGDKSSWYSYYTGILYARAGAVVLTYDPIGEGERNDDHKDATGEHDRKVDVPTIPARLGGLMITDAMQAVRYLDQRPDVDPRRVAVLGFSMGSFVSALTGAVDRSFSTLLLTGGGDLDGPDGYWDKSAPMCQSGPYRALDPLGDRPAVIFALNAQRGTTFILNGTNDTVVDIPHHEADFFAAMRQRTIALAVPTLAPEKNIFEARFVAAASHRPAWLMPIAAEWLDQQLHFPAWRHAIIASMPVVPIRDWAAAVGQPLAPSALRDDREGGMPALAAIIPHLTPEQLNVLPPDQWATQRDRFVYSAWLAHALKDAQAK